jgi:hypothetical protein
MVAAHQDEVIVPYLERRMRQDLSEGEFNHTSKTRTSYNSATTQFLAYNLNPHSLINQDRAHIVIRLHWKLTKPKRHSNPFVPGLPTDDNKHRCQLIGTPSAYCCSKSKFSPRGNSGFNIEFLGNSRKIFAHSSSSNLQNNLLVLCPQLH